MNWELDDELQICADNKVLFISKEATEADAELAASAPKLLAAMQALYDWAEGSVAYGVPKELAKQCEDADPT